MQITQNRFVGFVQMLSAILYQFVSTTTSTYFDIALKCEWSGNTIVHKYEWSGNTIALKCEWS